MKYIEGFNRNQAVLFPQCIDEVIPADAEVRIIDVLVDALPLRDLGFLEHLPVEGLPSHKASASKDGRHMSHPKNLLKLHFICISTRFVRIDIRKSKANVM